MNEILCLMLVFAEGLLLGAIFFGGLWLTVKKTVVIKQPALLVAGSFLLRMAVSLFGFYYIAAAGWQRMIICLLGFITARFMVTWLTRSNGVLGPVIKKEVAHEA